MTNVNEVRAALLAALATGTMRELVLAQVDKATELTVLAARLRQKALAGPAHRSRSAHALREFGQSRVARPRPRQAAE